MPPRQIAVLGGGITGLSSAFHLSRRYPQAQITVLEKSAREGGWIRSRRVQVQDDQGRKADICLESGPRTLRPTSQAVLELINLLGLQSSLITTSKSAEASSRRFLHIPGTKGLTELPSSFTTLFKSPLVSMLARAILTEVKRGGNRPGLATDESFDSLLTRRFGPDLARTLGSALVHGIYAADSRVLSVRAAFPTLWEYEDRGGGSLVRGMIRGRGRTSVEEEDYDTGDVIERMKDVSVFSFKDGLSTLSRSLRSNLRKSSNVDFHTSADVVALQPNRTNDGIEIRTRSGWSLKVTHVVSTLPLPVLQDVIPHAGYLPHLRSNPPSSVHVVNIIFPPTSAPIHPTGFGYLVPRAEKGYSSSNPGILGTVFDSSSLSAQDSGSAGFTKLTTMLGGPYHRFSSAHTVKPSTVLAHLENHLLPIIPLPDPVHFEVHEQKDCIPIPTVGHLGRMEELRASLVREPWRGRLEVVGAGVGGVSVGDCVEAGRRVGRNW